ncbi:PAS domain S-box protein [Flavobacterium flavipallidum]|uniref:histidine kinase n=1 Tax=Flavobacterium flavipallidum TaxID=3139140 RepID=A0ABU9HPZ7_9FLAO
MNEYKDELNLDYQNLISRIKEQEQQIEILQKDLNSKNNFLNEIKNSTQTSAVLIYSLVIKANGDFYFPYLNNEDDFIFGFNLKELKDFDLILQNIHSDDFLALKESLPHSLDNDSSVQMEYRYIHPVKGLMWHEINSKAVANKDGSISLNGIVTDVTSRMMAEQKISKAKRLYLFISKINQIIVRSQEQNQLFNEVCSIAVEEGNFKMAWIGLIDFVTNTVNPVSYAGEDQGYLSIIKTISLKLDEIGGTGPAGTALKQESYYVCNSISDDPIMNPWRKEALARGFQSLIAIPIKKFDTTIGVFVIYAAEENYFDDEEIGLLNKATADVTFALELFEKETLRTLAESAVTESEKRFHTLTEVSPVGIFRTNLNGATTYVNQRWTEIVGLSFEKSLGNGWFLAIHSDDRVKFYEEWRKVVGNREKSLLEYRFVKSNGDIVWVIGQATPETNAENQIIGFIGTITDITEKKLAEVKFVKTSKKMEAIIEAIPDLMFEVDLDGNIFNYHSSNDELLLMPSYLFIGKNVTEVLPQEAAQVCLSGLEEAHKDGCSRGKQYSLELSKGKHWFELSLVPMKEDEAKELHFIVISRDITEQKSIEQALRKNQERYAGLLRNLEAGIIVHDPLGKIIMSNSKAGELLGYTVDELISNDENVLKWDFVNEDYSEMQVENYPISQIIKDKIAIKNFPLGIRDAVNDSIVWVLVSGFPMLDENGNIQEVVISFIDVSEQRKMNYEIQKAKELAETANKSKTDFLANMSHEIRTPLNGIIGFTSLLMESKLNDIQKEYMLTINESATTLMDIVNDILDFSKIEAGKLELKIEEIDLFALINQIFSLFQYQANQKEIELKLFIDDNVPEFLFTDALRLKQIIVNLIGNAIKFTQKGRIELEVKTELPLEENFVNLIFSVKDTGIGIKEENQAKIFLSFVQEDNSTSRQFGGTGLGLAISNQLLALMDSKLELESTFGEGSRFYFSIRLEKSNLHIEQILNKNQETMKENIFGSKKVMIVEDNKINMFLAKTLITKIIPESIIIEARDGDEAIEQYKMEQPDIILMDIQMPNKNGFEATNEIRKIDDGRFTPIIALTAGIFVEEKEECLKSGMNDYITKPININDLESIVFKWLMD